MAERHDLDEAILGQPPPLFYHVIEHHGDLRHGAADVNETEKEEIKKHFAPRRHLMIRVATRFLDRGSSALQKRVERIEAFKAASQNFLVRQSFFRPTFEDTINSDRLDALKSRVVQVRVVDHLSNLR